MKDLVSLGLSQTEIARRLGITQQAVSRRLTFPRGSGQPITANKQLGMKEARSSGKTYRQIAEEFNCSVNTVVRYTCNTSTSYDICSVSIKDIKHENTLIKRGYRQTLTNVNDVDYCCTPSWLIKAARDLLFEIDTDPCSTEEANAFVKAKVFYDKETDGLNQPWYGNVWAAVPYSASLFKAFVNKALNEYPARSNSILMLVKTGNSKAHNLLKDNCTIYAPFKHRIEHPRSSYGNSISFTEDLIYFGRDVNRFYKIFNKVCHVYVTERHKCISY